MFIKRMVKFRYKWKPMNIEFIHEDFTTPHLNDYFKAKVVNGEIYYKITLKGVSKISGGSAIKEVHNFLVYLSDLGVRKISDGICEDGTVTDIGIALKELQLKSIVETLGITTKLKGVPNES